MKKKSHISLAGYLLCNSEIEELQEHRKAFYLGSILPDCVPSFFTRKHRIDTTFEILKKEIRKITEDFEPEKGMNGYYCRHLGVITHYLADYFTYPHNTVFEGGLREHCAYENRLKDAIQEYVQGSEASSLAQKIREQNGIFHSVDEICEFIKQMHENYLKVIKAVWEDCRYIVELCFRVVDAIIQLCEWKREGNAETKLEMA
ncbi:MAG: zinc dependent phospholipase C family protein [Lachnospiraceae bacterium]|nr:zinc dependent phospholipase C family protein [Lachnospiraceae bacterium]